MGKKSEKLVLLALASENVDEAVAALRMARQQQPTGKLTVNSDDSWEELHRERKEFRAERDAFEAERRDYQRRIIAGDKERAERSAWRDLGAYALVLGKPAAAVVLAVGAIAGMGYGTVALGGTEVLAGHICNAVGDTILMTCDS